MVAVVVQPESSNDRRTSKLEVTPKRHFSFLSTTESLYSKECKYRRGPVRCNGDATLYEEILCVLDAVVPIDLTRGAATPVCESRILVEFREQHTKKLSC